MVQAQLDSDVADGMDEMTRSIMDADSKVEIAEWLALAGQTKLAKQQPGEVRSPVAVPAASEPVSGSSGSLFVRAAELRGSSMYSYKRPHRRPTLPRWPGWPCSSGPGPY